MSKTTKKFAKFKVSLFFDIHPTKAYKMTNTKLYETTGTTPVLSNSSINNGIGGYVALEPTEEGKIITFSDTTTGANTMFYQGMPFIGYPHVQGMYPIEPEKWNEKRCLYFIAAIQQSAGTRFNYADKFNRNIVKNLEVYLPVVTATKNKIDWKYMEDRVKELEQERIKELDAYLVASGLEDYELTDEDKQTLSLSLQNPHLTKAELRKLIAKLGV